MPKSVTPDNRAAREAAVRDLVGDDLYEKYRESFDNADAVLEAARFVRQMREQAGLSQLALSRKLGMTQPRISEIERGDTPEGISYALLKRIAWACGKPDWPAPPVAAPPDYSIVLKHAVRTGAVARVNREKAIRELVQAGAAAVGGSDGLFWDGDVWSHAIDLAAVHPGTTIQQIVVASPTSVGPQLFKIDSRGPVATMPARPVQKEK